MRKMGLFALAAAVGFFAFAWNAHQWYEDTRKHNAAADSLATTSELVGWHDGRKQWTMNIQKLTRKAGEISASGIEGGRLYRIGASPLAFSAPAARYDEESNFVEFPGGVMFLAGDTDLKVGSGSWNGKTAVFEGAGVLLTARDPGTGLRTIAADRIRYAGASKQWLFENNVSIKWAEAQSGKVFLIDTPALVVEDDFENSTMPHQIVITGSSISGSAARGANSGNSLALHNVQLRPKDMNAVLAAESAVSAGGLWTFTGNVAIRKDNGDSWRAERMVIENNDDVFFANITGASKNTLFSAARLFTSDRKHYQAAGTIRVEPRRDVRLEAEALTIMEEDEVFSFIKPRLRQNSGTEIRSDFCRYEGKRGKMFFEKNVVTRREDGREIQSAKAVYDLETRVIEHDGDVRVIRRGAGKGTDE